ncbi:PAS/PAC sensor signal transduction histidine kinase [Desulfonatronospira thiodismutans ASO3-1]|uniref:histidine kinase n=1 Tax=Desulfonatronospira thiodismutans ASO3-1 TaxID=555779 RepID=D6SNF5_9BACT|nr:MULTISPECIES: PAS domain-containing hybrid sensor histidine kinase/response regulator [Desulfonatronospira]EFI34281.1 PAS/PAC sensor signal transduction histidine kinase [Desulfonatronospira thiodismutans ASO3-1]RQD74491.1 MAG: PAS domain-containing sensor histidine kinase [Desulfonatronospira sp. MSAO_Bac3]
MPDNEKSTRDRLQELREKAEKSLKEYDDLSGPASEFEDVQEVLQELSVYQVELSIQNEELQAKQEQLERTSNEYRRLFDFAPVGFFVFDENGIIEDVNRYGAEMLGMDQRTLHGKPFMLYLDTTYQRAFSDHRRRVFSKKPVAEDVSLKLKVQNSRGIWARIKSIAVEHGDQKALRCFTAMQDITRQVEYSEKLLEMNRTLEGTNNMLRQEIEARKKVEQELIESRDAAEAATKAKSGFLANMSHEIRTPLNGIFGMLQLMEDTSLDEEQQELLQTAKASGRGILTILSDILEFAGLDQVEPRLENRPFDLRSVVQQTIQSLEASARQKGLGIKLSIAADLPGEVCGDQARVRQILFNMLSNAVKFTQDGEIHLDVSLLRSYEDSILAGFALSDSGPGISDDLIFQVFQPFSQADNSFTRRHGGLGLGLSIARNLVKLMGGTIALDTEEGRGSTFYFTLKLGLNCPAQ